MSRLIFLLLILLTACNLTQTPDEQSIPTQPSSSESSACPVTAGSPTLETPADFAGYTQAFANYLSAGGSTGTDLLDTLRARNLTYALNNPDDYPTVPGGGGVWVEDVTGDGLDDVIVNVSQGPANDVSLADTAMWLYACDGNTYRLVAEATNQPSVFGYYPTGVNVGYVHDLNADGQLDIVYHTADCGAHTCYNDVEVVTWDAASGQLRSLLAQPINFPHGEYTIDSANQLVILTGGIGSVGAGPQRPHTWIYAWNGTIIAQVSDVVNTPPTFRFEALQDAILALDTGDYATAAALYQRVLDDTTLEELSLFGDNARSNTILTTHALFGLLVIAASQQDSVAAQSYYDALLASPSLSETPMTPAGESELLAIGRIFHDTVQSSNDVSAACTAVRQYVDALLAADILGGRYWDDFGYANLPPTGQQVCPM